MSREIKYYVRGRFEGYFKTLQEIPLNAWEKLPEDSKHLIRIYRGTISNNQEIGSGDFLNSEGFVTLSEVNNIQINKGPHWPEPNDRIFSLKTIKLNNVEVSGIQNLNGHTYGFISGNTVAAVVDGSFEEKPEQEKPEQKDPIPNNHFQEGRDDNGGNNSDNNRDNDSGSNPPSPNENLWWRRWWGDGCLTRILKWLLLLLLLYFILSKTEFGRQIVCYFQELYYKSKVREVTKEANRLQDKINRTRPNIAQCGSLNEFDGNNQERSFTYLLGKTSGVVTIDYDMFTVPDRMEVIFNGELVAETKDSFMSPGYENLRDYGFADSTGSLYFNYRYNPKSLNELTIRMVPNQNTPSTRWSYKIKCPQ